MERPLIVVVRYQNMEHDFQILPDLTAPPLLFQQSTWHMENEPTPTPLNLSITEIMKALPQQTGSSLEALRPSQEFYKYQRN